MARGISDPAPIEEESTDQDNPNPDQPTNSEIFSYLDELSDFVRELDIRLTTIEKFAIPQLPIPADKKATKKFFLTGK